MAVMKIGKVYYADYKDVAGKRRRHSLQTSNLAMAHMKFKEIIRRRNALRERLPVHTKWETFKDKLFIYLSRERAKSSLSYARRAIILVENEQKPRFLHDVTPEILQRIKENLMATDLGPHTINRLVVSIKSFMHLAERWRLIFKQDWSVVSKIKVPRGRVVFHTPEEIDRILEACPDDNWRLVVLLGADAGLRRSEMTDLKWEDVDFRNNQLYIAPNKTEYHRFVPMTEGLRNALESARQRAKHEYVVSVCRPRVGNRCKPEYLTFGYTQIALSAGVDSFLHKLRHTFASQLVQNGVELYTVSKLLGHHSIEMTEIYAHLAPPTLHRAVMNLPKHGMQLVGIDEKLVCDAGKACKQISVDFGDLMGK